VLRIYQNEIASSPADSGNRIALPSPATSDRSIAQLGRVVTADTVCG
jgi:hypothetical protein